MTTRTDNDPWNAWNLVTALGALLFFVLWLLVCPLGLFGRGGATPSAINPATINPTINALASSDITSNPLELSGTGSPNSSLQLRIGDRLIGPVIVGADGRWSTKADLAGLPSKTSAVAETLGADGKVTASSGPLELNLNLPATATTTTAPTATGVAAFDYPAENEQLAAKDYTLSGTGKAGDRLGIWQTTPAGTVKLGTALVGPDGRWNSYVPSSNPGTKPGTYAYSLRKSGSSEAIAQRTVIVKEGLTEASNAKCPCRLRIFTNLKQTITGSIITLFKDGKRVDAGTVDKLFANLSAGEYTFSVSAPGYETYAVGKATLPQNKNFEVYLKPTR